MDSLIEHIDSEEIVEFAFSELADVFVSLRFGHGPAVIVRAGNGSGAIRGVHLVDFSTAG